MSGVASLLTAMRVPEERDRTLAWAVVISILVHALFLTAVVVKRERALKLDLTRAQEELPVEVSLVEPPENPVPTDQRSSNLSTVSSAASDMDPRDTQSDVPHGAQLLEQSQPTSGRNASQQSRGQDGRNGEDAKDLAATDRTQPDDQEGLSEALQRSRGTTTLDTPHDFALPAEQPDFGDDGSASMTIGNITLNTTAWDFAPYLLDLKRRIRQKWIPPVAFAQLGAIHGYTWVNFRIYPDGRMQDLSVVETEGHDSLHRSSVNAIKGAAPFRPLPDKFPEDYLEITFGFYYLLPGDDVRYFRNGRPIRKEDRAQEDEKGSP